MREVTRSALTPFTPAQMFALVEDVERYPEFVPWISAAKMVERTDAYVIGWVEMQRAGVQERLTTRNELNPPHEMTLRLVNGPFRFLDGRWRFENIADRGSRVTLHMRFEFSNPLLNMVLGRSFEKNCTELVNAFVLRARQVYGAGA
jgi:ribosome-associated toxin RatA of RatAB toxin-antitoxin module